MAELGYERVLHLTAFNLGKALGYQFLKAGINFRPFDVKNVRRSPCHDVGRDVLLDDVSLVRSD